MIEFFLMTTCAGGCVLIAAILYHCGDVRIDTRPAWAEKSVRFAVNFAIVAVFVGVARLIGAL